MRISYEPDDNIFLLIKGVKTPLVSMETFGRRGSHSGGITVYTTNTGKRILPAHFKYGLAEISFKSWMKWQLATYMPRSLFKASLSSSSAFWNRITKDYCWKGARIQVPVNVGEKHE